MILKILTNKEKHEWEFIDNISNVKISESKGMKVVDYWFSKQPVGTSIIIYEYAYLLNDNGKTIEFITNKNDK